MAIGRMGTGITLSTAHINTGDRVDWWCEQVKNYFGTRHQIIPIGREPFTFDLAVTSTDALRLVSVGGSAHEAIACGDHGPARVMVRLQTQGHITLRAAGREAQVVPDTITLLPLRESGNLTFHDTFRHISFIVSEEAMAAVFPDWRRMSLIPLDATSGVVAMLADHMRSLAAHPEALLQTHGSCVSDLTLGLLGAVLSSQYDGVVPRSSRLRAYHLERAKRYVRAHLCNPALDVPMIADGIGVSVRYVHQLFSDDAVPVMRWVQNERLHRCRELLTHEIGRSVSDIAHAWGFSDHAHFTRTFRKAFGITPSEVRNCGIKGDA